MSAYHRILVDEFRQHGGTLTSAQLAAATGFGWKRDIHEMRKAGYLIVEQPTDLWHLDLEALPAVDVGGAGGETPSADADPGSGADALPAVPANAAGSPGADTDPQVEGETVPLFEAPAKATSPYDPSVEAA